MARARMTMRGAIQNAVRHLPDGLFFPISHREMKWWREPESNRRPRAYESLALPTELSRLGMVHPRGVEPPRPCGHKDLNLACMPISPRVHKTERQFIEKITRQVNSSKWTGCGNTPLLIRQMTTKSAPSRWAKTFSCPQASPKHIAM